LQEDRKTLAEAAAEHRQRKAQRQHVEGYARRLQRFCKCVSLWRFSIHGEQRSAFLRPRASVKSEYAYAGLSRTCRFLPSETFITPFLRSAGVSIFIMLVTVSSLILTPRDSMSRRASPLDLTSLVSWTATITDKPSGP